VAEEEEEEEEDVKMEHVKIAHLLYLYIVIGKTLVWGSFLTVLKSRRVE
jgi:hypothetical protein